MNDYKQKILDEHSKSIPDRHGMVFIAKGEHVFPWGEAKELNETIEGTNALNMLLKGANNSTNGQVFLLQKEGQIISIAEYDGKHMFRNPVD